MRLGVLQATGRPGWHPAFQRSASRCLGGNGLSDGQHLLPKTKSRLFLGLRKVDVIRIGKPDGPFEIGEQIGGEGLAVPEKNPFSVVIRRVALQTKLISEGFKAFVRFATPLSTKVNHTVTGNALVHHAATDARFGFQKQHASSLLFQFTCRRETGQTPTDDDHINTIGIGLSPSGLIGADGGQSTKHLQRRRPITMTNQRIEGKKEDLHR